MKQDEEKLEGLHTALKLYDHSGQVTWSRYNIMLLANSLIVTSISMLIASANSGRVLILAMSLIGCVFCFVWSVISKRGFDYHNYYLFAARNLYGSQRDAIALAIK